MAYVTEPLLEAAIDGLTGKHPVAVLILPSMVKAGVKVADSPAKGRKYGSEDEIALLDGFFTVPGAPSSRPFRAVWEESPANFWRDARYPGRSLQRMRTDQVKAGRGFYQKKTAAGKDLWALRQQCGPELQGYIGEQVRIADLAIWYGRETDAPGLDELVSWFLSTFPLDQGGLISTVFSSDVPEHYHDIPFGPNELSQEEYAEASGGAPPALFVEGDLASISGTIEVSLKKKGFHLTPGLVDQVLAAWMRGDLVVLVGQPGTGKTRFAQLISECLDDKLGGVEASWIVVRPDFDEAELIGYERLDGHPQLRDFAISVLETENRLSPHIVIVEECNLASIETYFSPILTAIQDPERRVRLPGGKQVQLPIDTFILATCNSYLDEPETRLRLSFAVKRRATIIGMRNILLERYEVAGEEAVVELTIDMIRQERDRIAARGELGVSASFDTVRLTALEAVKSTADLSEEAVRQFTSIARVLLESPEGREFFTVGLLRDIALALAYAKRDETHELAALGNQVAEKLVQQLRGPKVRADELEAACRDLPNHAQIVHLLDAMKSGAGDDLLPIV